MSHFRNRRLVTDAAAAKKYILKMRLLRGLVGTILVFLLSGYIAVSLYSKFGSLTISINKFESTQYSLTLSETRDFKELSATIAAKEVPDITNISGADLPADLDSIDGQHNGKNYFAYTFYLLNNGENTLSYEYQMVLSNVTNDVDKAIRIRLYVDGTPTTYARTRSDGTGPEPDTTEFRTTSVVMNDFKADFKPGNFTKFTVVIWIEGDDPDCTDELIGGDLKCEMKFSVIEDVRSSQE
ncbi:MAG: hypothetical protein KH054_06650 [Firmicutes bacterium]|nr:hypothetical protein [Bacillota bacterium]